MAPSLLRKLFFASSALDPGFDKKSTQQSNKPKFCLNFGIGAKQGFVCHGCMAYKKIKDKCIARVMIVYHKIEMHGCGLGGLCTGVEIVEVDNLMSMWHDGLL